MTSKLTIRADARKRRDALLNKSTPAEFAAVSAAVVNRLLSLPDIFEAKTWFVYVSTASELGTHELLRELLDRRYTVAVPLMVGAGNMIARQIHSLDELRLGSRGILEPPAGEPLRGYIDACICPGIAFSELGDRLGWGAGYYDRFLATQNVGLAIGLSLESQIVKSIPREFHDRPMDIIITELRVIRRPHSSSPLPKS